MSGDRSRMSDVTLLFKNGVILTMDVEHPTAEAVAVGRDGRIRAVGALQEVANIATAATQVVDLRGRTLIPGFFDCHMHLLWLGKNLSNVDLASPPVKDKADVVRLLRERLAADRNAAFVQGNFYDQNKLPEGRHLTRLDLDEVSADLPVRIEHTSGHAAVVNSRALELLGITDDTPDPTGGEIERGPDGRATGVLLEAASWNNLERIVPEPTSAQAVEALGRAGQYLLERGVTSATDADTMPGEIGWYAEAVVSGTLQVRTNCMVGWEQVVAQSGGADVPTPAAMQPVRAGLDGHRLHVGQAKLFSDGAITTRTCWLTQPFEGMPDNTGIAMHSDEALRDMIRKAHRAGWQIATHAIGDRAIDVVLAAYAEAQREFSRHRPDHRIEHCMLLDDELISRLRRQRVWSIGQPEFLSRLGDAYFAALGDERTNRLSPYVTLEAHNVAQAFSSDCPVVPGAPLDGLRAAMERTTLRGRVIGPSERIGAEAALYAYTAAPAFASRVERDRGTIEPGKWADFTLLSRSPLETPLDAWEDIRVEATIVGGECLYGSLD